MANVAITGLPVVGTMANTSVLPVVVSGVTSQISGANLRTFIGGGNAAGANTQVQFNDGNVFAGNTGFTFNKTTGVLAVTGNTNVGNLVSAGSVRANTGNYLAGGTARFAPSSAVVNVGEGATQLNLGGQITGVYATGNVEFYGNFAVMDDGNGGGFIKSSLIPNANIQYDLGNNTNRWRDLYLSGNTIYLGGASLSANGANIEMSNVGISGNITGDYFIGNGSQLTNINAATVDVTNTNGLTTTYYPTFVENRTTSQVVRADVDLSYRTDTNTLTVGNISAAGNITAGNISGNISVTGNIIGTSANVSLVAGSYTATFDNTGVLTLPTIGGDEGGEINFGIPATNTTLIGPVKVDVFQNRIRFFDGSTKGAYIDLSQAAAGVGSLLNNRVSGFVDAGTFVTMDNIRATVTSSAPRGLSLATVTGSFIYNIGGTFGGASVGFGGTALGGQTLTTTPTGSIFSWGFTVSGDISTYTLTDTTNNRCYRITLQIGASFNNNSIVIERLI